MKIYTKRGDTGMTDLYGAGRVGKDDARVEAYGTVDECNASLGFARSVIEDARIGDILTRLQNEMFCVGSELAAPGMIDKMPIVGEAHIEALEREIDEATAQLPTLKHFILPGGTQAASALHLARTIARRGERLLVPLVRDAGVRPVVLTYLNRLSDHLFTMARWANFKAALLKSNGWDVSFRDEIGRKQREAPREPKDNSFLGPRDRFAQLFDCSRRASAALGVDGECERFV